MQERTKPQYRDVLRAASKLHGGIRLYDTPEGNHQARRAEIHRMWERRRTARIAATRAAQDHGIALSRWRRQPGTKEPYLMARSTNDFGTVATAHPDGFWQVSNSWEGIAQGRTAENAIAVLGPEGAAIVDERLY